MVIDKAVRVLGSLALALFMTASAHAQQFPSRPIRVLVGFGVGGSTDLLARYHGQKLSEVLNVQFIIENKPGANQLPAIQSLITAKPDGYTLGALTGSAFGSGPALRKDLPYDPLRHFTYIGIIATVPAIYSVNKDLPIRDLKELVSYSIANPNKLNYGSAGVGALSHLLIELLVHETGLKATHIPFKANSDIMRELMTGSIHLGLTPFDAAAPMISSGKVKPIAVTGARRQKAYPAVPSLAESGFKGLQDDDPYTMYGMVGPAGMSAPIVSALTGAMVKVSKNPEFDTFMQEKFAAEPASGTAAAFRSFAERDFEKWKGLAKVIKLPDSF